MGSSPVWSVMNNWDIIDDILEELEYQSVEMEVTPITMMVGSGTPNLYNMPEGKKLYVDRDYHFPRYGMIIRNSEGTECIIDCRGSAVEISTMAAPGQQWIVELSEPSSLEYLKSLLA